MHFQTQYPITRNALLARACQPPGTLLSVGSLEGSSRMQVSMLIVLYSLYQAGPEGPQRALFCTPRCRVASGKELQLLRSISLGLAGSERSSPTEQLRAEVLDLEKERDEAIVRGRPHLQITCQHLPLSSAKRCHQNTCCRHVLPTFK